MAVIKSNAYGHGLVHIAKALLALRNFSERGWFGVDSITEAIRLRREGIHQPILVLGHTLPSHFEEAREKQIVLTISSFENLKVLAALKHRPEFHLKIDTGMHRQGFLADQIETLVFLLKKAKLVPNGIYTHFAEAKDPNDKKFTSKQHGIFLDIIERFKKNGVDTGLIHASASGGTLLCPESHFDMVRVGMGLYGYWPSKESKNKNQELQIELQPVLTWKTIVSEIKEIPAGSKVGYDLTEKVLRPTKIAVLPIGYWHGYDRGLSGCGEVLIRGTRAKNLGRISMDMTVADVTDISGTKAGDEVVLIGVQDNNAIFAEEVAEKIDTTHYEVLTRINPLIKRIIKEARN